MKKAIIYILFLSVITVGCGIRMQTQQLTDEWGGTYANNAVKEFQEKEIYNDQTVDVWGMEQTDCKNFSRVDTISFSGKSCLSLTWNRTGKCPWIGFGIGWNGYAAKDLTEVMEKGSIDFYIRAIKGKQFIPTLIFLLEDYSGVQTAALLKAKHLTHYPIDEEWQKVSIPLSTFLQAAKPLSDFSNIKSLNVECQGEGAFLIDKIEVGGANVSNGSSVKFGKAITQNFPAFIFKDAAPYSWGFGNYKGKLIEMVSNPTFGGNQAIHLKWNDAESGKQLRQFGMNWEHWQAIGLPDSVQTYALQFYINTNEVNTINNLKIGFESYNGKVILLPIKQGYLSISNNGNWQKVTIPFSEFNFETSGFDINRFKQFLVEFTGSGELWLDEISLQKSN
jgi:hypothetical protein